MKEPTERLKFTNSGQNSRLLAAALLDVDTHRWPDDDDWMRRRDGRASSSDIRKNSAVMNADRLDITLEIPAEMGGGETSDPLPSAVTLSIAGSDLCESTSSHNDTEELRVRTDCDVPENRFR